MYRLGIVKQQDLAGARVRVVFTDHAQMLSYWLPIMVPKTQNDKTYVIPDIGEQVVCLMDEHDEAGCVLGAVFSIPDAPPIDPNTGNPVASADIEQHTFKDGTTTQYNRATHQMLAKFSDAAALKYDAGAHALTVALPSGSTMSITANGATISIDTSGNVTIHAAGGISLVTSAHNDSVDGMIDTYNGHTHVDPQGGNTAAPTQQMA